MDVYEAWFALADSDRDGRVSGAEAIAFLQRSGLPKETLRRVWELADATSLGFLGRPEFKTAMQLLSCAQAGQVLRDDHPVRLRTGAQPPPPPPRMQGLAAPAGGPAPGGAPPGGSLAGPVSSLPLSAAPPLSAAQPPPSSVAAAGAAWPPLTQEAGRGYVAQFKRHDVDGDGFVTGAEAKAYFSSARVAQQAWLRQIWDLADAGAKGSLTLPEFVVASYFLEQAQAGRRAPRVRACAAHAPQAAAARHSVRRLSAAAISACSGRARSRAARAAAAARPRARARAARRAAGRGRRAPARRGGGRRARRRRLRARRRRGGGGGAARGGGRGHA